MTLILRAVPPLILFALGCVSGESAEQRLSDASARAEPSPFADATVLTEIVPDCPIDTMPLHEDPASLVAELAVRDTADNLSIEWLNGALTCSERLTGDQLSVVVTYQIAPKRVSRDSAVFELTLETPYHLGWDASGALRLQAGLDTLRSEVLVLRTNRGWRIDNGLPGAHRSPAATLRSVPSLSAEDQVRLSTLIAPPGA